MVVVGGGGVAGSGSSGGFGVRRERGGVKRKGRVLWTARCTGGHLRGAREKKKETDRVRRTTRLSSLPCPLRHLPPSLADCPRVLSLSLGFACSFSLALSLPVARHELTYSLERRVCVLTRSAYVMGARWSPPLWYRIFMPIRRAECGGATAATITTSDSSTLNGVAAAVATTVAKTTTGKSPVSSCTRDVVLARGHGSATILIRSKLPNTRWYLYCCWRLASLSSLLFSSSSSSFSLSSSSSSSWLSLSLSSSSSSSTLSSSLCRWSSYSSYSFSRSFSRCSRRDVSRDWSSAE